MNFMISLKYDHKAVFPHTSFLYYLPHYHPFLQFFVYLLF